MDWDSFRLGQFWNGPVLIQIIREKFLANKTKTPFLETLANGWVFDRVNLHSAFDQIQWDNDGVGETT